ncbi:MAG: hypothetical protein A2162_01035 [Deltaproteobacteria bacterium RBG_13_52_11b]|nr:MAG: hypothetical protein A2162_01035 [Deltaproteobacteria bacterium RBG_13_52_11b]
MFLPLNELDEGHEMLLDSHTVPIIFNSPEVECQPAIPIFGVVGNQYGETTSLPDRTDTAKNAGDPNQAPLSEGSSNLFAAITNT